MKPGTYVFHKAGGIHYDGAKDEPAVIQVWGTGPMTTTQAEAAMIAARVARAALQPLLARRLRGSARQSAQSGAQNAPLRALSSNGVRAALEAVVPQCERSVGRSHRASSSARRRRSGSASRGGESVDVAFVTTPVVAELAQGGHLAAARSRRSAAPASASAFARARAGPRSARPTRSSRRCSRRSP